jgi:hypothetical protein
MMASNLIDQRLLAIRGWLGRELPTVRLAGLVAAAGLGQATADQVADGQQGDQEPSLVSAEPLTVRVDVDHQGGDQHTEDRQYVDDQLGGLERRLGLPGDAPGVVSGRDSAAAADHVVLVGGAGAGHASPLWRVDLARDAACPAKDYNRPDTAHISLTAIAPCDLHRTMLQSELLYTPVGSCQTRIRPPRIYPDAEACQARQNVVDVGRRGHWEMGGRTS